MFVDAYMVRPAKWLYKSKYAAGAIPDIFRINFPVIARPHRKWLPCIPQKLVRLFVHTDNRTHGVVRKLIDIKNILHTRYEFGVFF